jgi:hypothetical protein
MGSPLHNVIILLNDSNGKTQFSNKTFNRNIIFYANSNMYFVLMQYQIYLIVKIRIQEKRLLCFYDMFYPIIIDSGILLFIKNQFGV